MNMEIEMVVTRRFDEKGHYKLVEFKKSEIDSGAKDKLDGILKDNGWLYSYSLKAYIKKYFYSDEDVIDKEIERYQSISKAVTTEFVNGVLCLF